jgi:hypothetical protein
MDPEELRLDGNAAAGLLMDIFGREMTEDLTTCTTCRAEHPLGRLHVYSHGMGTVIRCASCGSVQMQVASIRGAYLVDLRGVRLLHLRQTR